MPKKFILATPFERLQHYPRYLKAIALRLDKARSDPARDTRLMADWQLRWASPGNASATPC
jgi:ATP-dependent helicase HrpA